MSVREALRAATAEIHEALHGAEPFARIAEGHMDRAGYAALLRFLFSYHAGMEAACIAGAVRLGAPELGRAQQRRLSALRADLAVCGSVAPAVAAPAPQAGDFAVGCFYTVLGSTLGGKVIFRQLDALLPGSDGRRFFQGAADDALHWQLLCAALESRGDVAALEAGARHGFERFAALLCGTQRELFPA